jgi:hypothetical protein
MDVEALVYYRQPPPPDSNSKTILSDNSWSNDTRLTSTTYGFTYVHIHNLANQHSLYPWAVSCALAQG